MTNNNFELLASIAGNVLLFALVFGMSATVEIDNLKEQLRNRNAIVIGAVCQFLLLPVLGFMAVKTFELDHTVGISLLVVTSSPGGSYSNWWCSVFNADLALSVTMTAISTVLSIAMLPINLLLYTSFSYDDDVVHNLNWVALFLSLFVVISAIVLGLFSSYKLRSDKVRQWANVLGNISGVGLMIFSATVTNNGDDSDSKIWSRGWRFYCGVSLPCVLGLFLTNIIATFGKLKRPERVTVAIECCYQNVGIATSLALTMFSGDELNAAMGVPFFYAITEILLISVYCLCAWKGGWTKAPATDNVVKVIFTSYEVKKSSSSISEYDQVTKVTASDIDSAVETEIVTLHNDETVAPVASV